jgi:nitroreductase
VNQAATDEVAYTEDTTSDERPKVAEIDAQLAATDLGVGSGRSVVSDQDRARWLLGFPNDPFCAYLVALGYPADGPLTPIARPNRRPFDEVVHSSRWSASF